MKRTFKLPLVVAFPQVRGSEGNLGAHVVFQQLLVAAFLESTDRTLAVPQKRGILFPLNVANWVTRFMF